MGSIYGNNIRISLFGQSHSPAIGVVVDGLPAGFPLDLDRLQAFLSRRAPGQNSLGTRRKEGDRLEVLSGLVNGRLCGAPFAALIRNRDANSKDYASLHDLPRPGHADYPAHIKMKGAQDVAGGGHFSGRLTAPLALAGGICLQLLSDEGIDVFAHILQIADVCDTPFDPLHPQRPTVQTPLCVLDVAASDAMAAAIEQMRMAGDSIGGVIECTALNLPVGLGDPMFRGLENTISQAVFAIPAVKGIAFGSGFAAASMRGSEHNDSYRYEEGRVVTTTNHHGGILGGLSTGMPLLFTAAIKPTASIYLEQDTISLSRQENARLAIKGRHDPCIVPRAVPVVEAAAALALYDAYVDYKKEKNR